MAQQGKIQILKDESNIYVITSHGVLSGSISGSIIDPIGSSYTKAEPVTGVQQVNEVAAIGNNNGTINLYNAGRNVNIMANIPYTDIVDKDNTLLGNTEEETVNRANVILSNLGGAGIPVITSNINLTAAPNSFFKYQIEATNEPFLYNANNLPDKLLFNQFSGLIIGTTESSGTTNFNISCANGRGSAVSTVTLTITSSFANTLSTDFNKNADNHCRSSGSVSHASSPWTKSLWYKKDSISQETLFFAGSSDSAEGWICEFGPNGRVFIRGGDIGSNSYVQWKSQTGLWQADVWSHIVILYESSGSATLNADNITVYHDDVDVTSAGTTSEKGGGYSGDWGGSIFENVIGGGPNATFNYFDGHIDELSIWSANIPSSSVGMLRSVGSPADLDLHPNYSSSLASWWRMGDGDTFPQITDHSTSSNNLIMYNMTAGAFTSDVP